MKKAVFFLFLMVPLFLMAQTAVQPVGDGSEGDPYQIASLANLEWFSVNGGFWDHYVQTANIDASATAGWDNGAGFDPKDGFEGSYDGNFHTISGLTINRPGENYVGFFGSLSGAVITRVVLQNVNVTGHQYVASIAGQSSLGSTVSLCSASGNVEGWQHISGLVDWNLGTISQCVNHCTATSYTSGWVGGISAYSSGSIENSYSTGIVKLRDGSGGDCGGLIGGLNSAGSVSNCYAKGQVSYGTNINSGLINHNYGGPCNFSYWDTETTGQSGSACGTGLTTAEMAVEANFIGWDFDNIWVMSGAKGAYPQLQWEENIDRTPIPIPLNANMMWLLPLLLVGVIGFKKIFIR